MTVRQLFYQLVSLFIIQKTEQEYKSTVCRLTKEMRLNGELPWNWLADNTRWMHKPRTYGGIDDLLASSQRAYRRALWDPSTNPDYCEVWIEKDALTGVFYDVTKEYDVPLMPCKGYPSLSFIREAAETLTRQIHSRYRQAENGIITDANAPSANVYYFGDFDPSGVDISRSTEARLREFILELSGGDDFLQRYFHFHRVAVNHDQIEAMGLPTRPTKKSDSRSAKFGHNVSVEVDAINPDTLRQMTRDCITAHIDEHQLQIIRDTEASERQLLEQVSNFTNLHGTAALSERLAV
ncbi:hypothetical protein [Synechococcus sp. MIT S9503]|uniref:hypothetical protein n=1 Tax=Synechococcus sp. MIT S9503 TaxID=3082547 RepID=UPI0039A5EDBA